jgi:bifunctional non-homologous end joining protein LigD
MAAPMRQHKNTTRSEVRERRRHKPGATEIAAIAGAKSAKLPDFVPPQLATLVDSVPAGDEWLHEIKFDGYRILCRIDNGRVSLLTREAQDWTHRFQTVAATANKLPVHQALLDGEVVALEDDGTTNFQRLQNSLNQSAAANIVYFAFDLLYLDGYDLTRSPLLSRKKLLERFVIKNLGNGPAATIRYSEHWLGQGKALFEKACQMGLEGIIAKRADQPHRSGRSRDWLKIKSLQSQEFVIGGFTDPAGSRVGFGALLLGVYDEDKTLRYAGRVGTGFNDKLLRDLRTRLGKLIHSSPPFVKPPAGREAKGAHWVKPELVGEVAFTGWTRDGVLRHPSFKGLREDKPANKIQRETATPAPKPASSHSNGAHEIAGIKLTHPDRILYPEQGITKGDLARYYEEIADWILPHVEGRPLTLVRCPEGHKKQCFYQRHSRESLAPAIHSVPIKEKGSAVPYLYIDSLSGLIALVQIGVLELHTWGSRKERIEQPDRLIFDLDPDPSVPWQALKEAAQRLRSRLADAGLAAFLKTTGGKGLHVVVPIVPKENWEFAKKFSKGVADGIVREAPEKYIATMSKAKRKGKIFIDYLRNARTATAICAYSTRARAGAPVSVPLDWEELSEDVRTKFTIRNVPQRLGRHHKDPWEGYEAARATITAAMMKRL